MAYLPHCRVILSGVLGTSALNPSEIWSTGHQISDINFANLPSQSQVDAMWSTWRTAFASSEMNLADFCFLTRMQVVAIASDGSWRRNVDGSFMKREPTSAVPAAGIAGVNVEYPVSSVVSLLTPRAGAHGRGRQYWPVPAEAPGSTGHVSTGACDDRAGIVADALGAINATLASGTYQGVVVVASEAGFLSPVDHVRCGDVHDTQRRRRNALAETYSVAAV